MKKLILIIFVSISTIAFAQNGITWNMGMNISTNTYSNMHPRMALDGTGNPMVIWGRMADQSVFFSKWNGTIFTMPVKLNPAWLTVATAGWMGPDIAAKGDTVYVVVKRTPETSDTNRIFIITSFNGGISFNAPVELAIIADSISRFPTVTVDDTGNPIVAYMKFNAAFLDSRWVVTKSTDFGNTFSTDAKASGYNGMGDVVCDCCPGALVNSGSVSAMLYRDNASNIRDIWTGISNNNNASFNNGFTVDNNNWQLFSCPSSGPDGVIIGDTLYSVFMNGGSGNYRTYLSKSSISNGTVGTVSNLTGTITGLSQQNYPRIASDGNAIAIVWKQTVSGSAQLPILFTNNSANGFPAAYDTVDLNDITNADVAMSNGNVYVVWEDDNSGTIKYRSGTYTQVTTSIKEMEENNFSVYPNPVSDILTITTSSNDKFSVNIFNSLGQNIYSSEGHAGRSRSIQTANFPSGIYFLQLTSQDKIFSQKLIVNN